MSSTLLVVLDSPPGRPSGLRRRVTEAVPARPPSYHPTMTSAQPASGDGPTLPEVAPATDERLAPGTRAGDYELERHLGAGAMGDVYAGKHPLIGKRVAIKVIKRALASSAEAVERFLREARAANRVGHANVVDVFALGRLADGRLYLVMDLLEGEALAARVRRGRLAPERALAILAPIAGALDAAHARGVVHRDLKPDNVFLSGPPDSPTVFVLDFGIAKLLTTATDAPVALTGAGTWLGTPAYMAPEQWSADGAGPASDRYALGVMAYQLLTGDLPFHASSLPGMMEQHFRAAVPTVSTIGIGLPAGVDAVLARAMAKDPDDRYPTAQAMIDALTAVGAIGRRGPRPGPARGVIWAGGALLLAMTGAGAMIALSSGEAAPPAATARADGTVPIALASTPSGAIVRRGGRDLGTTPMTLPVPLGATVELTLVHPGYLPVVKRATADTPRGASISAALVPVKGFEGTWAMADGALRGFERRGEQVAAFRLDRADGPRTLLRMYGFVAAEGDRVAFTAAEELVDERAANEPSCHIALTAEYRYQPVDDVLELRRERARYDLVDGRCVVHDLSWSERATLRRVGAAGADHVAEAAGAGPVEVQADGAAPIVPPTAPPIAPQVKAKRPIASKAPPKPPNPTAIPGDQASPNSAQGIPNVMSNAAPGQDVPGAANQAKDLPAVTKSPPAPTQGVAVPQAPPTQQQAPNRPPSRS
jgi:serine/threonine-protein kinase